MTHAASEGSPITMGEEVIKPGWKVVDDMTFLRLPIEERCPKCDWTKS